MLSGETEKGPGENRKAVLDSGDFAEPAGVRGAHYAAMSLEFDEAAVSTEPDETQGGFLSFFVRGDALADQFSPNTPPKRILFATDLSARSDRALDRATQLANQWGAELLIVHALGKEGLAWSEDQGIPSWRHPPGSAAMVEDQIREDIRGECPRMTVQVEHGPAVKVILEAAERERCDLIVVGAGRQRDFVWPPAGHTIDELFRRSPASVLVVKTRPRGPYAHLLIGTDFTPEAQRGFETAVRCFPEARMALMHAFEMPYRALLMDSQLSRDFSEMERTTLNAFVAEAQAPDAVRERLLTLIEHGPPEEMLSKYVVERGADLTIIGAYERSFLFHATIVGNGPRIVEAVPSDVLVVRAQRPGERTQ